MIRITPSTDGCSFVIKAKPNSRRNQIAGEFDGQLKVAVTAPPENGKANEAIRKLLSEVLSIAKSDLTILRGQSNSTKTIRISGIEPDCVRDRIERLILNSIPRKRG